MVRLVRPEAARQAEWLDVVDELGEDLDGSALFGEDLAALRGPQAFAGYVARMLAWERPGADLPTDRVPATTRWAEVDGQIVGFAHLRHELNDALRHHGGHVGYSVRPSRRREGIATAILAAVLAEAGGRGIDPVMLCCRVDNEVSRHIIEAAGGVVVSVSDGFRRYWVPASGRSLV